MTLPTSQADSAARAEPDVVGPASPYAIKLSVFEGPLDLLLHLIRQNEVEITDIPIAEISSQYLAYLDAMRELNLDVVGDYLVMAATLAWIKSRMLLPAETVGEDGEEIDPRAELNLLGRDVFDAVTPDLDAVPEAEREIEVGLFELVRAFKEALDGAVPAPRIHEVEIEPVTVRERMIVVMEALAEADSLEFTRLIVNPDGSACSRPVIVATFLAILELTRLAALRLYQSVNDAAVPVGPIHARRAFAPGDPAWKNLISEVM
jgi:segregation and condensation protein A